VSQLAVVEQLETKPMPKTLRQRYDLEVGLYTLPPNSELGLNLHDIQLESTIKPGMGPTDEILSAAGTRPRYLKVSESGSHYLNAEVSRVQEHLSTPQTNCIRCEAHTEELRIAVGPSHLTIICLRKYSPKSSCSACTTILWMGDLGF